jgi:endonuclease YncB( thermonuclease family)
MERAFRASIWLLVIMPLLVSAVAYAGEIEGEASAIDGDSLNMEIRLFGIDTPEADQTCKDAQGRTYPCGQIASEALAALLKNKVISCEIKTRDRYGRQSPFVAQMTSILVAPSLSGALRWPFADTRTNM